MDTIQKYDDELRSDFGNIMQEPFENRPVPAVVLASGVHNRLLRLWRPWMTRGYRDPKYAPATKVCVDSARSIVHATRFHGPAVKRQWFLLRRKLPCLTSSTCNNLRHADGIAAAMVIYIHMLHLYDSQYTRLSLKLTTFSVLTSVKRIRSNSMAS